MKRLTYSAFTLLMMALVMEPAFSQKLPALDASPADVAIFRPEKKRGTPVVMKVTYGRPQKKGRTMLGEKEPFGQVWRTGANESTELKLYRDVTFGDKKIPAGTYTLYTIPNKDQWTIIFNSKLDTWGAYEYEESKDVARIQVPAGKTDEVVEAFTIAFDDAVDNSSNLVLAWENTKVKIPFKY